MRWVLDKALDKQAWWSQSIPGSHVKKAGETDSLSSTMSIVYAPQQ